MTRLVVGDVSAVDIPNKAVSGFKLTFPWRIWDSIIKISDQYLLVFVILKDVLVFLYLQMVWKRVQILIL